MVTMNKMKVRVTLLEELLGTASGNKEIHEEYIASKSPDAKTRAEEIAALGVEEVVEKAQTVFPRDEKGNPFYWDYQIRGFFKDSCGMLKKVSGTASSKATNYKKLIDGLIFVEERKIPIKLSGSMDTCQRPLRAQTSQGERITLANSETVPAGSTMEFTVCWLPDAKKIISEELISEWLEYGLFHGLGQWRNSGKGKFTWEVMA